MLDQDEIDSQQERLATHRRTLAYYLNQEAKLGEAYTPPGVFHGIDKARDEIRRIKRILRAQGVTVEDYPDDDDKRPRILIQPTVSQHHASTRSYQRSSTPRLSQPERSGTLFLGMRKASTLTLIGSGVVLMVVVGLVFVLSRLNSSPSTSVASRATSEAYGLLTSTSAERMTSVTVAPATPRPTVQPTVYTSAVLSEQPTVADLITPSVSAALVPSQPLPTATLSPTPKPTLHPTPNLQATTQAQSKATAQALITATASAQAAQALAATQSAQATLVAQATIYDGSWVGKTAQGETIQFTIQNRRIISISGTFRSDRPSCPIGTVGISGMSIEIDQKNYFSWFNWWGPDGYVPNRTPYRVSISGTFLSSNYAEGSSEEIGNSSPDCDHAFVDNKWSAKKQG